MPWELFDRRRAPTTTEPRVTIQKTGVISFNLAARNALNDADALLLFYDAEKRRAGFQKAKGTETEAYPLRRQQASNTYNISGQKFCRYYQIELGRTRRYKGVLDGKTLAIDIDSPTQELN